jgi:hypothetical protein
MWRASAKANPGFLKDVPDDTALRARGLAREKADRAAAQRVLARASGVSGTLAGFAGGVTKAMEDPVNIATLPLGGGGRTVAARILTEGFANAGIELLSAPKAAQNRALIGEGMTTGEAFENAGLAFVGGVALQSVGEGVGFALRKAFGDVMTADEIAATFVIDREAEIDAGNPFAGDDAPVAHRAKLQSEIDRLIAGRTPAPQPVAAPRAAAVVQPGARQAFKARVGRVESGGNDAAKNPLSSATGRYQFIESTWLNYYAKAFGNTGETSGAILAKRSDGAVQERLMDLLTADNARALSRAGVSETAGNLYLAHFAGPRGAIGLHRAALGASAADVLGASAIRANPFLRGMSASDVIAWAERKMGGKAPASAPDAPSVRVAEDDFELAMIERDPALDADPVDIGGVARAR